MKSHWPLKLGAVFAMFLMAVMIMGANSPNPYLPIVFDGTNLIMDAPVYVNGSEMVGVGVSTATVDAKILVETNNRIASDNLKADKNGSNIASTSFTLSLDQTIIGNGFTRQIVITGVSTNTITFLSPLKSENDTIITMNGIVLDPVGDYDFISSYVASIGIVVPAGTKFQAIQ